MIGHEHKSPQREVVFCPCPFDGLDQPLTCSLGQEESPIVVATECKFMGMSRDIVPFAFLCYEPLGLHVGRL